MGAEPKNPGKASFSLLRQGVLSMLSCANALMRHFTRHIFSGCFDFAPKTHDAKISFTRSAQHDSADGKLALYFLVTDATREGWSRLYLSF